ncbi:MAG TPA: M3 family metallopeptidase, partial [Xanthobacteraceae bacterium]
VLKQEPLAATFEHLTHAGLDDFYRGDVGREIAADLDLHSLPRAKDDRALDPSEFEAQSLDRMGMPEEIAMRHRLPHFAHIFAGGGYAAGYYSYMWSEVLDADAFSAFEETGDIFDPATAKRLRQSIYAAGGLQQPADAYKAFRGRLPTADALLRKRGFVAQDTR